MGLLIVNTIQKEYRSKLILSMGILTLFVLVVENIILNHFPVDVFMFEIDPNAVNPAEKKLAIFYSIITIWSSFLAALVGINTVRSDIEFKVLPQILSLPVSRLEYLMARVIGGWLMVVGYYVASIAAAILYFNTRSGPLSPTLDMTFHLLVTSAILLVYILTGLLFSLYLSRIMSFLSVVILFLMSSLANRYYTLQDLSNFSFSNLDLYSFLGLILHLFLPRVEHLKLWADSFAEGVPLPIDPGFLVIHYFLSIAFLFWLTYIFFRKREI